MDSHVELGAMPVRNKLRETVRTWIGIPDVPAARKFAVAMVVDAIGTGMLMPIAVLYFTVVVKLPLESVGLGLGLAALIGVLSTPAAGTLIDRIGAKNVLIASFIVGAAAFFGYLAVDAWWTFLVAVSLAQVAESLARPAKKAFVASIVEAEDRVRLLAFQRSIRNVGYGTGALVTAGLFALDSSLGYQLALIINGITFLAAAVLIGIIQVVHRVRQPEPQPGEQPKKQAGYRDVIRDKRYVGLTLANVLVRLHATALFVGLPLWVERHTTAPTALVGVLFTMNTVLVVVFQVRMVGNVATAAQTRPVYLRAAGAFVLAAVAYAAAGWLGTPVVLPIILLTLAVLAHTVAELYGAVGEWTVSLDLAPEHLRGRYLSVFSLSASLHDVIGPALITFLIARIPDASWLVLSALLVVGCLISAALVTEKKTPVVPSTGTAERSPA
jgi:MFS family permease